jgi:hypothetical protein
MLALLIGAQAAMITVEFGGVLSWWCASQWWVHIWYFAGQYIIVQHEQFVADISRE